MQEADAKAQENTASPVDVRALVESLREEVVRAGPRTGRAGADTVRLNARAAAARLWRVTADRPPAGRGGAVGMAMRPVKYVVRRLTRWYVEPVFADQRAFNDALLKLVDDLYAHVDRLEAELEALRAAQRP